MEKTKKLSLITPYNLLIYYMEVNKDIYNLICLCHIAQIYNNDFKKSYTKVPNRVKIIRDFDNLLNDKYIDYQISNNSINTVKLSDDKLFSKLQKIIFRKINNYSNLDDLKEKIINDIGYTITDEMSIYEVANIWCQVQYGLI
jgi:hypothetical protein